MNSYIGVEHIVLMTHDSQTRIDLRPIEHNGAIKPLSYT